MNTGPNVSLTITADNGDLFDKNACYQVEFNIPNCNVNCSYDRATTACGRPGESGVSVKDAQTIVVSPVWDGNSHNQGEYDFWLGKNLWAPDKSKAFYNGAFNVYQDGGANGGLAAIELPQGSTLPEGGKFPCSLLNTAPGTGWTIWLDGETSTLLQVDGSNNGKGGNLQETCDLGGTEGGTLLGQQTLCADDDNGGVFGARGLDCKYSMAVDITPSGAKGSPTYSNQPGVPLPSAQNTATGTTNANSNSATCNPPCNTAEGLVCVNSFNLANNAMGGGFNQTSGAFSFAGIFGGTNICVPITPTPSSCYADSNCLPYTCDTKSNKCTTTPMPPPTPFNTPDPLCPHDKCQTALGIIPTQPTAFIAQILVIILSFAGGIAILLIINAGYHIMMSGGNPEKLQEAREGLTSALVGLLFIIFSVAILQFIAYSVLHIPGFGQ